MSTAPERAGLIELYRRSGLTQQAFVKQEGLRLSTFTSWLRGHRGKGRPGKSAVQFVEASVPVRRGLEVQLPDGVILRGGPQELAELLKELKRC